MGRHQRKQGSDTSRWRTQLARMSTLGSPDWSLTIEPASLTNNLCGTSISQSFGDVFIGWNWIKDTYRISVLCIITACEFNLKNFAFKSMWYDMTWKSLSHVRLFATPQTVAHQAPLSMGFSRQEYWSGLPFPSPAQLLLKNSKHYRNSFSSETSQINSPEIELTFWYTHTHILLCSNAISHRKIYINKDIYFNNLFCKILFTQ